MSEGGHDCLRENRRRLESRLDGSLIRNFTLHIDGPPVSRFFDCLHAVKSVMQYTMFSVLYDEDYLSNGKCRPDIERLRGP